MPNPLTHNGDAANFVSYYASPSMEADVVKRLHSDAVSSKKKLQQRAAELKNDLRCPVQTRTPREIDAYSKQAVYDELNKRERRKAALEAEIYGGFRKGHKESFKSKVEQDEHLKSVYTDPFKKAMSQQAASNAKRTYIKSVKNADEKEKERWWRYSDQNINQERFAGRAYLVSDMPLTPSSWKKTGVSPNYEEREEHWNALARPLLVTPKVAREEVPEFTIYSKFRVPPK